MTTLRQLRLQQAGARAAAALEMTRGESATVGGLAVNAAFGRPTRQDMEYLPGGAGNEADPGTLVCNVGPQNYATPDERPKVGAAVTRPLTGQAFTVKAVWAEVSPGSDAVLALRLLCSRTPQDSPEAATDPQAAHWADPPAE